MHPYPASIAVEKLLFSNVLHNFLFSQGVSQERGKWKSGERGGGIVEALTEPSVNL